MLDEVWDWVGLIRRCVLYHSELIWERIKGALGAPPELDPDDFEEDPFTVDTAEPISSSPPREIIQGIRISTRPSSPGLFATDSGQKMPTLSRTMSVSSMTQPKLTPVPGEPSSLPKRRWSYAASTASSEAYDVAGERGPGNPLFPTSFARLSLGPTLTPTTLHYVRATFLLHRHFPTRMQYVRACCAGDAVNRVGLMVGTRRSMSTP
ncbi:hypothetical protein DFH94DRAFT_135852 [Russula ochroleuca]|uniref:Uncharacterized protein n=1 Tax=Russula ochroleuca TaxID=152965 RepID=A0A9P5JZI1_9AGAM|nr:hypothetical protein DFH94DRAFT_135852 [Russula ochroleuca]